MTVNVPCCKEPRADRKVLIPLSYEHVTAMRLAPRKRDEPLYDLQTAVHAIDCECGRSRLDSCELGNTCTEYLSNRIFLYSHGNRFRKESLALLSCQLLQSHQLGRYWILSRITDIAWRAEVDCNHALAILQEIRCMVKTEMSE